MDNELLTYCEDQVRRFDHDRYLCALFAGEGARARLMALYAFNVEIARVRELVSEPVIGQMRLQWWRDAIGEFAAGRVREHPVAQALAAAVAERPVSSELFERLLTGREFDLGDTRPDTLAALEQYAADTSAALSAAALSLLGVTDAASERAAHHVGIAWALTGLLRAISFHAQRRRLYLPQDLLAGAGVTADEVIEGKAGGRVAIAVRSIAERSREHLRFARAQRQGVAREALPVLLPARLADRHLRRLERAGFDPFSPSLRQPLPGGGVGLALAAAMKRY